ncbi:MAG: DivIVA domain-containing protein [Gemmatimonadales bacterium]|nr:MAG: DivIVA domain-containing protein [Gemmatimonadales bacterium]
MIDLTPLDIRQKRGDFRKGMRGYDPAEVDGFLELAAERLEEVVKALRALEQEAEVLRARVEGQEGRQQAVQDALVTAQELREEIREQARREADLVLREAEEDARRIREGAQRVLAERQHELDELNRARDRFLRGFRTLLEREMDAVRVEEERPILEKLDLDALQVFRSRRERPSEDEADHADDVDDRDSGDDLDEPSPEEDPHDRS